MLNHRNLLKLGVVAALSLASAVAAHSDTLMQVTSSSAQGANDTLAWSQKGADGTVLPASFSATTATANPVTVSMGAANSIISVVCTATPCSWTGAGFTAGHSLLWSSDAGNGGSGPVTINFSHSVAGAGALIQADLPGGFTGQIQVYNGTTLLATYTVASDTAGDPVYLGAIDQTGANISKAVFSLTTCASLCTDFGLDTVNVNAASTAPALTSPTPGSKLTGSSQTFTWTPGTGSTLFRLRLGTTVGGGDIYNGPQTTGTTAAVTGIPTYGMTIYARLYYVVGGTATYIDYTYTEAGSPQPPALVLPTPGSKLAGSTQTFTWAYRGEGSLFKLRLGTTLGGDDIYDGPLTTGTSETVTGIPSSYGATLYARLFYEVGSTWSTIDYTYTEAGTPQPPVLTSPTPGSTLAGSSATFTWTVRGEGSLFKLRVGTTLAGDDIYNGPLTTGTSAAVTGIPTAGHTLYVRLYYEVGSTWSTIDYTYTEAP